MKTSAIFSNRERKSFFKSPSLLSALILIAMSHSSPAEKLSKIEVPPYTAHHWTLPDGLNLIVQEDHSAPVASVQAWCQTGSIDEDKHLGAGLSHILEHMLFKGTETRSNSQFAQKIQDAGGYINAYTSYERTVFWIDIPSKGVSTALDLLSDAMMNSTLPPEEYTKEQEVIRREFAMGYDDPDRMANLKLFETAFSEHPFRLPVIGHIEIYNKLTRDDVMQYYKERYVPNNLFFVVTGDVDAEKVHEQLAAYFEKYPRKSLAPHYIPQEPLQLGRRESHTEFPTELTRLQMAWHTPGLTDPSTPALDLLSTIIGSGRSSRLYRRVSEELKLVHSISAYSYTPGDTGLFGVDAILDPDNRQAAENAILGVIEEVKKNGITVEELEKGKRQTISAHLQQLTTMRGKASDLGSNWQLTRNLNFSTDYLNAIQKVTVADIKKVLGEYFQDQNLTVVSLNPPGSVKAQAADAEAPKAGEIQKFDLSNGLRLLVREDPRLPLVSMVSCFKAGVLAETPEDNGITKLYSKVLLKGTKTRSAAQIAEQIESVGGDIGSESGNNSVSVSVKVMKPDIKLGLEILADVLLHPTLPENEVAREKQLQIAALKAEEEEMVNVASKLLRKNLFQGHPYALRPNGTRESLANLDRQKLQAFHEKFAVGKNGVISVFGNVKASEVKALVEQTLGKLPTGQPALVDVPQPKPLEKDLSVETNKQKAQAILMVGFLGSDIYSPDAPVLELINEACSDLGSRFFLRIREQMGLAYFVSSSQTLGLVPGPFVFYLGTAPQKVEAVKKAFLEEISKLAADGLTPEELTRAKEKLLGQQDIRNQSNDSFAYATALDELYGLGFAHYKDLKARVEAVTLEDVKRVTNQYFQKPYVFATVEPAAKEVAAKVPAAK